MKKLCLLLILALSMNVVNAQTVLSWQKTYGGTSHEYIHQTIPTADGGFAFVGYSESGDGDVPSNQGGEDLWVAKANAAGILQWSFTFGGTADEEGTDLLQTADGGFFVAGWTDSGDGDVSGHHGTYDSDFWVLKLSAAGALLSNKCYGGTSDDEAEAIELTQDGKLYIAGRTYSNSGDVSGIHGTSYTDLWVIKIDTALGLLAQKCVGGTNTDEAMELVCTADNGCIITGRSYSTDGDLTGYHAGSDLLVAKLTSDLLVEWAKCYGGSEIEEGNSIVQNADQTYTVLGYTSTHNNGDITGHHGAQGMDDFWLIKIANDGALTWAKCYGGSGDDQANGLTKSTTGGWAMCGLTNSTDGDVTGFHTSMFEPDYWVARVDVSGNLQWQRCCGGSGQDESFRIYEESANVFVVTGFTYSHDGDVTNWKGDADGWIIKVTGSAGISSARGAPVLTFYPHPVTNRIHFNEEIQHLSISTMTGAHLFESSITDRSFDLPDIAPGLYLLEVRYRGERYVVVMEIGGK